MRRYRSFIKAGLDALTIERIKELIEELQQRKEAMHCLRPPRQEPRTG
jgi:hypothetical protein